MYLVTILRTSLIVSLISLTGLAHAESRRTVRQMWCDDGQFHVVIEPGETWSGLGTCVTLASARFHSESPIADIRRTAPAPFGNVLNFVFANVLGRPGVTYHSVAMTTPKTFQVRGGDCGGHAIFVVRAERKDLISPRDESSLAALGCSFDAVDEASASSIYELSGVYPRVPRTSAADFLRALVP